MFNNSNKAHTESESSFQTKTIYWSINCQEQLCIPQQWDRLLKRATTPSIYFDGSVWDILMLNSNATWEAPGNLQQTILNYISSLILIQPHIRCLIALYQISFKYGAVFSSNVVLAEVAVPR